MLPRMLGPGPADRVDLDRAIGVDETTESGEIGVPMAVPEIANEVANAEHAGQLSQRSPVAADKQALVQAIARRKRNRPAQWKRGTGLPGARRVDPALEEDATLAEGAVVDEVRGPAAC